MSDVKKEVNKEEKIEAKAVVPELSLLDQLKMQHASFIQQKDLAQNNLNQLVGAIYACEMMIKKHEDEEAKKQMSQGETGWRS